ncbi:MAG: hypothetical protein IJW17_01670 [Lentisphaeria bacterium]|jgi:hypothetical protein|nr:hypothetical protein [Lentisphaeria bacterium]
MTENTAAVVLQQGNYLRTAIPNNLFQNQKPAHLRGVLLPKLLSGEINASEVEM